MSKHAVFMYFNSRVSQNCKKLKLFCFQSWCWKCPDCCPCCAIPGEKAKIQRKDRQRSFIDHLLPPQSWCNQVQEDQGQFSTQIVDLMISCWPLVLMVCFDRSELFQNYPKYSCLLSKVISGLKSSLQNITSQGPQRWTGLLCIIVFSVLLLLVDSYPESMTSAGVTWAVRSH